MTAYSIGCTTCHARLVVRDTSVVGQIVACPKCGSMVLITPPHASAAESGSIAPAAVAVRPAVVPTPPTTFDELPPDDAPIESSELPPPPVSGHATAASTPAALSDPRADMPTEVPTDSRPASAAPWQSLVWIGAGVGGGVVLALGLFFLITAWRSPPTTVAQGSPETQANSTARGTTDGTSDESAGGAAAPAGTATAAIPETTVETTGEPADGAAGDNRADIPAVPTAKSPAAPAPAGAAPAGAAATEAPAGGPETGKSSGENPAAPPRDPPPLAGDSKPDFVPQEPEGPPGLEPQGESGQPMLPAPVAGRFAGLISGDLAEVPNANGGQAEGRGKKEPTEETRPPSLPPEEEIIRPRMREVDINGRLADPIGKLSLTGLPLDDFVRFVSDLSTIPVTLDAEALRLRRISAAAPVSVQVEQTTTNGVLAAALEPLHLGVLITDTGIRVTHPSTPAALDRRRAHDVSDLAGGDPQRLEVLRQWILELVLPETWSELGGKGTIAVEGGTLVIQNRDEAHFQVIYLCEKLRAARKLGPRGKYAAELVAPERLPQRGQAALSTPIKLNFNRSTRLTQILTRLAETASLRVLIDWNSLYEAGWSLETMARLNVDNKPLSEALEQLLTPRDLAYRMLDDQTLEVTTPAAIARHVEWEFYSVADLVSADQDPEPLLEQLQAAVGAVESLEVGAGGAIRFDAPSRSVLVALPVPQHLQVVRWLADRRQASPP